MNQKHGWTLKNGAMNELKQKVKRVVDFETMKQLNTQFRGKTQPTNVLSFANDEMNYLGDIALGYEIIVDEATSQKKQVFHHVMHLITHGFLHLQGYTHDTTVEAARMESLEVAFLKKMHIPDPYRSFPT